MIQIEKLHIEEFRGIRSIDLDLKSRSFVVYGPNGSGKSGVVDAIEFALTGNIGRLAGEGTGGVTVARHAPHVHRRDDPGAAKVALTVRDVVTGESAAVTRTVKDPTSFTLDPDTPTMRQTLQDAMGHPELSLSRKELIKYVVARPGDRAQEVQALLRLDKIENLRRVLKTTSSKATAEANRANDEQQLAESSFRQHLGLPNLLSGEVLREVNLRRSTLGLDRLTEFTPDVDVLQGATPRSTGSINLKSARTEVTTLRGLIDDDSAVRTSFDTLAERLAAFSDPTIIDAIRHRALLDAGLAALDGASCPLCQVSWMSRESLEGHLRERLAITETAEQARVAVLDAADKYRKELRDLRERAEQIAGATHVYGDEQLPHHMKAWIDTLVLIEGGVGSFEAIAADDALHSADAHVAPGPVVKGVALLAEALEAAPDESAAEEARTFLDIAKDRWVRVRAARVVADQAALIKEATDATYSSFCEAADQTLAALYKSVEANFSRYYQFVNSDDEGAFRAELTPKSGSLELTVDFYKLGMFPPIAYHSEGHQDGMGVCLYLALVKQLLGENLRYAVLDDVVMSVDSTHRRRFAELLKTEFVGVQFVITTHDEVWARQMRAAGLVTSSGMARFYGWTVDAGPTYSDGDVWNAIEVDLQNGDVAGAAHKLRRTLEASASDIAESVGGVVAYRSDASYDLSVFLDSIKKRYGDLLGSAAASAQSWGNQPQVDNVKALKLKRGQVISEHDAESWLVNKLVHNNDWANATVADFRPVLGSAQDFLQLFRCSNSSCGSWISVSGRPGNEEALRCACQEFNLNLLKKR